MKDPREGCVAVQVVPNATGSDFTVAAERHCIAPTGCWWPKCACAPCGGRTKDATGVAIPLKGSQE
jgi:hypothetical protein